ncbi:unnamed protein product [Leptidea sinapis]|uniref:Uncharacterized protein n=1 Tax=Leptidea sinapis TaxID=189913 RepID=A0A5E4R3Z7_9NEOP|nr:unnamed protein product [Leptidea sinapis]
MLICEGSASVKRESGVSWTSRARPAWRSCCRRRAAACGASPRCQWLLATSITMEPNPAVLARVLAIVSDLLDLLLEDWYPTLEAHENHLAQALKRLDLGGTEPRRLRLSEESRASDRDSGVGNESTTARWPASAGRWRSASWPRAPTSGWCATTTPTWSWLTWRPMS